MLGAGLCPRIHRTADSTGTCSRLATLEQARFVGKGSATDEVSHREHIGRFWSIKSRGAKVPQRLSRCKAASAACTPRYCASSKIENPLRSEFAKKIRPSGFA